MMSKCKTRQCLLVGLLTVMFIVVMSLSGCGGGGGDDSGGDDGGDDGGPSYPAYSTLDVAFDGVVINHFADRTVTLQNGGTVNLPLGQIETPEAPFTIVQDDCSDNTLTSGETCEIQVRFEPTEQLSYSDGFAVPITDSDTNFVGVNLDGDGYGYNVSINQIEADCPDIRLLVSVTDSGDNPVIGLDETDFVLYADDAEVAWGGDNTVSSNVVSNLSVILLIDTSGSVSDQLDAIKAAATAFVGQIDGANEVAIFNITDSGAGLLAPETDGFVLADPEGKTTLNAAIDGITQASGYTALYQAVMDVSGYMEDYAAAGNRRAIILVTDGEDNTDPSGEIDAELVDAIAAAQQGGVPLFTIGLGVQDDYTEVIIDLSEETGGQYFLDPAPEELDTVYSQASALLSSQYIIVYHSTPNGGATMSLRVTLEDGSGYVMGADTREIEGCPNP